MCLAQITVNIVSVQTIWILNQLQTALWTKELKCWLVRLSVLLLWVIWRCDGLSNWWTSVSRGHHGRLLTVCCLRNRLGWVVGLGRGILLSDGLLMIIMTFWWFIVVSDVSCSFLFNSLHLSLRRAAISHYLFQVS